MQSQSNNPTIALAGNPNCGKTTIFNALTGLRQKVANYPGVTVEKKTGKCSLPDGRQVNVIDLPGTYSLISRSPDEVVAMEVLRGLRADTPAPDVVIVVVDASNLQRNLYLVSQLIELGRPLIVALNMMDVAQRRGLDVSPAALSKELGVPVIPIVGHKKQGVQELKLAIGEARVAPLPDFVVPDSFRAELMNLAAELAKIDAAQAAKAPTDPAAPRSWICGDEDRGRRLDRYVATAERLLIGDTESDLKKIVAHDHVAPLLRESKSRLLGLGIDPVQTDVEAHYRWIENISSRVTERVDDLAAMGNPVPANIDFETPKKRHFSERLDAVLIHKFWGLVIFTAIMATLFVTIFWLAAPIMEFIKGGIGSLGEWVASKFSDGPIRDLVKDGIFAGVGGVVVFVPQIAILFFFLAILEDSGYLARAAFLMDRLLGKVGLHGKSFIPLLSSFACAIPGIMATRTIEDRKSRLATILIAPFMSCSARLPVYTLLIGTFFASTGAFGQAGIMLALYAIGIIAAAITAWFLKRWLMRGPTPAFILELPTYKRPQMMQVARQVYTNTWAFLAKAGTVIFCLSIILWAMTYYPSPSKVRLDEIAANIKTHNPISAELTEEAQGDLISKEQKGERVRNSVAGWVGHTIEPLIRPLGYDWKMGVGLVGAFAAREVFVSTMGIIYSAGEDAEETTDLVAAMRADVKPNGKPVWSPLVAASLLVWFVLAMQCMSTLAIVRRETGGWTWPIIMLLYMNGLAYIVSLGVYQIGRILIA